MWEWNIGYKRILKKNVTFLPFNVLENVKLMLSPIDCLLKENSGNFDRISIIDESAWMFTWW